MLLILPRKGELQKYLATICYPCVRYTQFWQKNVPTRYDQGSVILSQTLDRHALRKSQRTGRAGDDAYPEYFDSFQRKCLHLTVIFCCLAEEISLCYHQRYTYARSDHFKARTCKQMSYLFLRNFVGSSYAIITFWIAFGL